MFVVQRTAGRRRFVVNLDCKMRQFRDGFQNHRVLRRFGYRQAPGERGVIRDEHGRHFDWINTFEGARDEVAGVFFVGLGDFAVRHRIGYRHCSTKIVGVGRSEAGNWPPCLGPGRRVFGVSVGDATDLGELFVKDQVRRQVGGRAKEALAEYEATLEVTPRRFRSLAGAAAAARTAGDAPKAEQYAGELLQLASHGDGLRPELAAAKSRMAAK